MELRKERESGIELLKIVAMIMIIFSHAMPTIPESMKNMEKLPDYIMQLELVTDSIQRLIVVFFKYSGQLGNTIFIICSAWFLVESNKVNFKKVLYMIADSFTISVIGLIAFLLVGYELPTKTIIKQFLPLTTDLNWFIACYLLFYLIHPGMNKVIDSLSQRKLLGVNVIMLGLYSGIQSLIPNKFYYNYLIGFICIYFFTAYVKKYLKNVIESVKVNVVTLTGAIVMLLILIGTTNYLGFKVAFLSDQLTRWNQFVNPLIIMCAMSIFQLMRKKQYFDYKINYISSMSMLFFIIHHNYLIMHYFRIDFFKYIYETYTYKYELVWVLLYALILIVGTTVLSIVYKETLQKIVRKICNWLYKVLQSIWNRCIEMLLRLN